MRKHYCSKEEAEAKKLKYESLKMPYQMSVTRNSIEIMSEDLKIAYVGTSKILDIQDVNFIGRVSSNISSRLNSGLIKIPNAESLPFEYCKINTSRQSYEDVIEIDINSAYWRAAMLMGIISKDLHDSIENNKNKVRLIKGGSESYYSIIKKYKDGSVTIVKNGKEITLSSKEYKKKYTPSKDVRLMSLGVLNKKIKKYRFDGQTLKHVRTDKSTKEQSMIWQMICHKVYELFQDIIKEIGEEKFILYWVDAIIVKKEQYEKVTKMIKERGFDSKTKEVKTVEFKNGSIIVSDPKGVERIFKI